jgi:antitoxin component YwqK of YwqJK toxin-antitoxin module
MKRISLIGSFYLLTTGYINAQDAIQSSATPVDNEEKNFSEEYYLGAVQRVDGKTYLASLFKSPEIKFATYTYSNKELTRRNGTVVGYNGRGDTQFTGNYQRNKLFGEWRSWYDNRQQCDSGNMINDVPDGKWKSWYPDGKLRFVIQFDAAKLVALKDEILRQPKTRFFTISKLPFQHALNYIEANYIFGNSSNARQFIFGTKKLYKKSYDELALKSRVDQNTTNAFGDKYVPPFAECLMHGNYISFYADGRVKETGSYVNGLRDGLWEEYSEKENRKAVGTYRAGQRKGEWRYYNDTKLLELKIFDSSGNEKSNHNFTSR